MSDENPTAILDGIEPGLFDLDTACIRLANLEHEPLDQMNSDTLWVELRLACAEVKRLQAGLVEACELHYTTPEQRAAGFDPEARIAALRALAS